MLGSEREVTESAVKMRWAGHVARMGDKIHVHKFRLECCRGKGTGKRTGRTDTECYEHVTASEPENS